MKRWGQTSLYVAIVNNLLAHSPAHTVANLFHRCSHADIEYYIGGIILKVIIFAFQKYIQEINMARTLFLSDLHNFNPVK